MAWGVGVAQSLKVIHLYVHQGAWHMRTTLVLEDGIFREAKKRAAELGLPFGELVAQALRQMLQERSVRSEPPFLMPTFGRGAAPVAYTPVDFKESLAAEEIQRYREL